ncbi:MAG: efflux RND transporter periplasmic adaptor subunit [Betaproteobacteria bacterium]|nr:efflux RND transporter periplasmic adaptor subunit [Betaproteobacteria bacterium]
MSTAACGWAGEWCCLCADPSLVTPIWRGGRGAASSHRFCSVVRAAFGIMRAWLGRVARKVVEQSSPAAGSGPSVHRGQIGHAGQCPRPNGRGSTGGAAAGGGARVGARLGYSVIRAPSDGTLIARSVERGDVVQPGKDLMVLSPAGETQLVLQIDERNLSKLRLGQSALASADAFAKQKFPAELVYINPGIDAQRGTLEVKLRVPSPPDYLRQDMTVSVDIEIARHADAIVVPTQALHNGLQPAPWVLKVVEGKARRQPVRTGLRGDRFTQVLEGLRAGDVVLEGSAALRDGQHVRPVMNE